MIENKQIIDFEEFLEVKELMQDRPAEVHTTMSDQFCGFYLYDSLTTGDFNLYSRDVDFAVVTQSDLADEGVGE